MVNWKTFEAKYENREQWAFEQMSYFLFCSEMNYHTGIFRYKNQIGIETESIEKEGVVYGFQAKYYTTPISKNISDIIDSIQKAKSKNKKLNVIYFYIYQELSESRLANKKKPKYQNNIEQAANNIDIKIEWRVKSHLDYQLPQLRNKWIADIFFGNNGLDPVFFKNNVEKEIKNLGPRFNKELSFELPIAQLFDKIAHNDIFYKIFIKIIDNWLTEKSYQRELENEHLSEIENEIDSLKQELMNWIKSFKYSLTNSILLTDFLNKLQQLNRKVSDKADELLAQKDWKNSSNQFDKELSRLREIKNNNYEFIKELKELTINLVNNPTLIIQGQAGSGKSHLLGDISTQRNNQSLPTILLLGTTFNTSNTIEKNILDRLDLTCSFKEFLNNLNNIGFYINSRVLILIDAINEGAGLDLWKNQIAGFVSEISKYPAIGLVMTIRSTYFDDIIPVSFKTDQQITIVTHSGFKGSEYEALKLFSEFYNLKLPDFPILNPEYSNPLFLHLICEYAQSLPEKCFPKGFNGISRIYQSYKDILNQKFDEKRHEYKNRNLVSKAIAKLANAFFNTKYIRLELDEAVSLFDKEFFQFSHLLSDLIEESVLVKMRIKDNGVTKDFISFSYQKLGDFFIAEELIKPYSTKEEVINAFTNDEKLRKIADDYQWKYNGIIELLSVLLPEKYGLELFEIIEFFYDKNTDKRDREWLIENTYESFTSILLGSLKWRNITSNSEKKITKWLKDNGNRLSYSEWISTLIELTSIHNHPFNSDRLYKILIRYSMPERDSFLQEYLMYNNGYDNDNVAFPLRRLIDWAWTPNISYRTDAETARLVSQTLAWVLSSTNIALRDQTTKALVNLLEQQPNVLITVLKLFEKIDDVYILERLFAVAYGCILRTENENSIKIIGQYIYDTIFKDNNPPIHVLLRDYARNVVEYAIYKNIGLEIDSDLIIPPYKSEMPILPNSEDDVKEYDLDYDSPDFKKTYGYEQNAIYSSVISGIADFGRYVIDSAVSHFTSLSFREDERYYRFLKTLKKGQKEIINLLYECKKKEYQFKKRFNSQKQWSVYHKKYINILETAELQCLIEINDLFNSKQVDYINKTIVPYFERKLQTSNFNSWNVRYWIVKRVFELGYKKELHGEYDSAIHNFYGYNSRDNKIERIGKKYQWIAFYEIIAHLADNYKLKDYWRSNSKYEFYKGPWQLSLRNIDPAYITLYNADKDNDIIKTTKEWWEEDDYNQWNFDDSEWVETIEDLPEPKKIISKKDANNTEWLYLQHFVEWNEPKKLGIDKYEGRRKQIFYLIQGLLVKKSSKKKIINHLKIQNFWGRWLPENNDDYSMIINREKFWSPAYIDTYRENKRFWKVIRDTKYKVIVTTESANSGFVNDKSGANLSYNIPCKYIFEGMKLQYAPIDGKLNNSNGEVIAMNNNYHGVLIRKRELIQFLDNHNLDIIWTVLGEKISFSNKRDENSYLKVPCGVYYLEDDQIKGKIKMYDQY